MKLNNLIIAHRGIHNNINIPENSILAFSKAIKKSYPIELDVQLTKDNILIVFHDKNLKRMTGCCKDINELTYNEIKKLKLLNTYQIIPTLKDVLNLVNGKVLLDIEIKSTKKINKICEILTSYNHPFIIKSFSPRIIRWFYKNNPDIIRGLLISKKYYNGIIGSIILNLCKPNFLAISKNYIKKYGLKKYYRKYPIMIWTIQNKQEINIFKYLTTNYICNNLPYN